MRKLHALFPVKLFDILQRFEKSKRGQEQLNMSNHLQFLKLPNDDMTRAVMSSPPLFDVLEEPNAARIRLAYYRDNMRYIYETQIELYSSSGDLLEIIKQPEWTMALSLAIEAELLERILDINPL